MLNPLLALLLIVVMCLVAGYFIWGLLSSVLGGKNEIEDPLEGHSVIR